MSLAGFIADQRARFAVPHVVACRALEVSESWFYKWNHRDPTPAQQRRHELNAAVAEVFTEFEGRYGSPRACGAA